MPSRFARRKPDRKPCQVQPLLAREFCQRSATV